MAVCTSCGRSSFTYSEFTCPGPGCTEKVMRCAKCRESENSYACKGCGFKGP